MKALALAAALLAPGAALAHGPEARVDYNPGYAWFVGPGPATHAQGRIRVVAEPRHGRAALTLNQVDAYQQAYRRSFGQFARHMSIHQAEARARHAAWHAVVGHADRIEVDELTLRPLQAGALPILVLD